MTRDLGSEAVERASRILAQAFGYGDSWFTADLQFGQDSVDYTDGVAANKEAEGLPIARRTETLERADRAANVGEFHHWKRCKGVGVTPRVRPNRTALGALAYAKLDGPLEDWLLLYALQDWSRWPRVRDYAIACRPDGLGIEDAAERILFRTATLAQDGRARMIGIRASTFREQTAAAEIMLRNWLGRAAGRFLSALETG